MRVRALASMVLLLMPLAAGADGLKVTGSLRERYEALSGQSRPGFNAHDQLLSSRAILDAEYLSGDWRWVAEVVDSRAWLGDDRTPVSTSEVNALEPTQFYVAWSHRGVFGPGSSFEGQAGRFALNLGSRRLIANDEYRNTGSSNFGVRAEGKVHGFTATGLYLLPTARLPEDLPSLLDNDIRFDRESAKAVLWGGVIASPKRVAGGALELTYLKFKERDAPTRPTRDRDLDNWNLRWFRDPAAGAWDYEFETNVQHGRSRTGLQASSPLRPVDAGFTHARLGYQWGVDWKPRLAFEYDWASGDTGPDRIRRYDTLFGMRRADLAPSGLYAQIGRSNLASPALRFEAVPNARLDLMGTYRVFYLASRTDAFSTTGVRDPTGRSGRLAGQQVDVRARYWVVPKQLRFELDTIVLVKGRFLESAPNARPGDTRFYSLNLTWSF